MLSRGLPKLRVRQLARLLDAGALTSEQLSRYCYTLAQAGEDAWKLQAFAYLLPQDHVLEQARRSDEHRRKRARPRSLLEGLPVSIKANIAVEDLPLTAGSRILGAHCSDRMPLAGYHADVTESLLSQAGAVCLGSTTMDEFGMGSLGNRVVTAEGTTAARNPTLLLQRMGQRDMSDLDLLEALHMDADAILEAHNLIMAEGTDPNYSAGGSSCGSAVSVAHGSSVLSLGTDTGGSVRLPAAWCGIVGLKPTCGLLSRHGLVSYASSLDCPGILANSADCATIVLEQLLRHGPSGHDSTMVPSEKRHELSRTLRDNLVQATETQQPSLRNMTIGIPAAFSVEECPDSVREVWQAAMDQLERMGATIQMVSTDEISADMVQKALSAYYVLACAEASSNLARYNGLRYGVSAVVEESDDGGKDDAETKHEASDWSLLEQQYMATRANGFGSEVVKRILSGTAVLSSDRFHTYYEAAAKLRSQLTQQIQAALESNDLLLVPTCLFSPASLEEEMDATEMLANDVMTVPFSLAGLPAISISPERRGDVMFVPGLQLIGKRLGEVGLLKAATAWEVASRTRPDKPEQELSR